MPDLDEKIIDYLISNTEVSMNKLFRDIRYGNRNKFFETCNRLEKEDQIKTKKEGRERLVSLSSPDKKVRKFVNNFGKNLDHYEKIIKKNLNDLEKNNPLVSTRQPMKKIKTKIKVLELDKKNREYRDLGKTENSFNYTWRTRPTAKKHFDILLHSLNRIYQESSALTFEEPISADPNMISEYQKRANKLIKDTVRKIQNIYQNDGQSLHFAIYNIRNILYGIIYRNSLENEIRSQ